MDFFPLSTERACMNCNSLNENWAVSEGNYVCRECGAVQTEQVIDERKEWRDFDNDESVPSKSRAEIIDDDFNSLGTEISTFNYGSSGISTESRNLTKYSKMAQSSLDKSEHYLRDSFCKLNDLSEILQLPNLIRQTAREILRQFEKKRDKNMKGIRKEAFILAVLLIASKQEQGGRTLKGFARITNTEEKDIKRFYKLLLKEQLNLLTERRPIEGEVKELVEVFCNKLEQPFQVVKEVKEVASKALGFLEGKRPSSVAAAAILFIFTVHQTPHKQQELAAIAGISTNTLRNVYRELNKKIEQLPNHLNQIKANVQLAS